MSNYQNLLLDSSEQIITITISRPQVLNALNTETMKELGHFFTEGYKDWDGIRGVIITGSGEKAFVAGADISEFSGLNVDEGQAMADRGHAIFNAIEGFHLPVLAAVNGFALGGGCELAMACHLRIAAENARFGQPEVNLGLIPGYGGTQRLVQLIGKTKAMELLMTADMIQAPQALDLGLVNAVVPADQLMEASRNLLLKIAGKAPLAIAAIIKCVNSHFEDGINGFQMEIAQFGNCSGTEDFKEGASAFLEKRKANFQGK
jgi:enoyl-CoA hydratase